MKKRICLFDIDGTLTPSRQSILPDMKNCLKQLAKVVDIGLVGGSDAKKIRDQLDQETISGSHYFFSENGLVAYKGQQLIGKEQLGSFLGEEKLQKLVNFCLHYIADLKIPVKRGTFIEYRTGMLNVSPIGRNCSQAERDAFQAYDKEHKVRGQFMGRLKTEFADYGLQYSIGGQISFDVFPKGWDKTYCLRFLEEYDEIYFYGDKTYLGGNDHQIYEHCRKEGRGFSVTEGPKQTIALLKEMMGQLEGK